MSYVLFVLVAIVCSPFVTAQEDILDLAMDKCLYEMNLLEADEIDERDDSCLTGCMLQELEMIDEHGKLLPNGIEDFVDNISSEYRDPNLIAELHSLKPRLSEAKNACEVGAITDELLSDLFETEFD